jgi:hypothetical protein
VGFELDQVELGQVLLGAGRCLRVKYHCSVALYSFFCPVPLDATVLQSQPITHGLGHLSFCLFIYVFICEIVGFCRGSVFWVTTQPEVVCN